MKNIKKDTVIRTVILIIALVNTLLNACGKNTLPFTDDEVSAVISAMFTFVVSIVAVTFASNKLMRIVPETMSPTVSNSK